MNMKKLLLFGAGKIGRSFIGQLFGKSGYEIIFADIDANIVELLNKASSYKVITADNNHPEKEDEFIVKNVSALLLSEKTKIIESIVEADIIALSVGKRGLLSLSEMLAEGIRERYHVKKEQPIDIILAENVRDAADLLRKELKKYITDVPIDEYVGLVETSIGKMVPIMTEEQLSLDPLTVVAEPYNSLIVDELGFRNTIPDLKGLAAKKNMKAWVDRKIFIHNMGHATLAYHANYFNPELIYTWEALGIDQLREITRKTMIQSMDVLMALYPDEFTKNQLTEHIDDLLDRFSNKALGDTIFRVGCDLSRKLNKDDRLMVPIIAGIQTGKDYSLILEAWVKGCFFKATDKQGKMTPEDENFKTNFSENPILALSNHCKFNREEYSELYDGVMEILKGMNSTLTD